MDKQSLELWKEFVEPYYMFLFNGRWFREQANPPHFVKIVKPALSKINDSIIEELLVYPNWRHQTVGCWFAGIKRREIYIEEVNKHLGGNFRQMATCFALVNLNQQQSINYLFQYLERFIAEDKNLQDDHWNNIHWGWAIQALTYLDREKGKLLIEKYYQAKNKLNKSDLDIIYLKDENLVFTRIEKFCKRYI